MVKVIPSDGKFTPAQTANLRVAFKNWKKQLDERRDVFLGYCGAAAGTAAKLKRTLVELGATVLDWKEDFPPGRNILKLIEQAAGRCSAGIFLFTRDDEHKDTKNGRKPIPGGTAPIAAPRDNVIFEAGYFINAKGKDRVLIVREEGAKMPADLGGDVYALLKKRADIRSAFDYVRRFVDAL
jgi:predicted nucleotide-binding protein